MRDLAPDRCLITACLDDSYLKGTLSKGKPALNTSLRVTRKLYSLAGKLTCYAAVPLRDGVVPELVW